MIDDDPAMANVVVHGCSYRPEPDDSAPVRNKADLLKLYLSRVTGEIQRLRINAGRKIFVALDTGGGYVQCAPASDAIYCEAQSAESWPVLSRILKPDRVAKLHAAGFADPGRSPNYWKAYATDDFNDRAIAEELLTVLYDVYGYDGLPELEFKTEKD
jgi:hypothetical protein